MEKGRLRHQQLTHAAPQKIRENFVNLQSIPRPVAVLSRWPSLGKTVL
jgi:hypothetical protein